MRSTLSRTHILTLVAVFVLLCLVPLVVSQQYFLFLIEYWLIFSIAALGLNLIWGYTGLISIGHSAYFALGAYTTALLTLRLGQPYWLAAPAALLVCGICGVLIGIPVLRLSGHYLAIATLSFGVIVDTILVQWIEFTGGSIGLSEIPSPSFFGYALEDFSQMYYLVLFAFLACFLLVRSLIRSSIGRAFQSIRENQAGASAVGINVPVYRNASFAAGAMLAGAAGSLYAPLGGHISPASTSSIELSVLLLVAIVVGGAGTLFGPVLGAAFVVGLPELLSGAAQYRPVIFGLLLAVTVLFVPGGINSIGLWLWERPLTARTRAALAQAIGLGRRSHPVGNTTSPEPD